jgi:hypothetical protein
MTAAQYREFVAAETEKFGKIVAQGQHQSGELIRHVAPVRSCTLPHSPILEMRVLSGVASN